VILARSAAVIVALLIGLFAMPAAASTLDVHADYLDNGVIDRPHDPADLRAALEAAAGDAQYAGLAAAITDALEQQLLGRMPGTPGPVPAGAADRTALGVLPSPRAVEDSGGPPLPLLGLALLAGALVMTGVGSSVYRRAHSGR
jgi:hypothetical protein